MDLADACLVRMTELDLVTEDSLSPHIGPHILREVQYVNLGR